MQEPYIHEFVIAIGHRSYVVEFEPMEGIGFNEYAGARLYRKAYSDGSMELLYKCLAEQRLTNEEAARQVLCGWLDYLGTHIKDVGWVLGNSLRESAIQPAPADGGKEE